MTNNVKHTDTFAYQRSLHPDLAMYPVPKEYREFRDTLIEVNRILESGIERRLIMHQMEAAGIDPSTESAGRMDGRTPTALRYSILLAMKDYAHRELAMRVPDSRLKHRINSPKRFITEINNAVMEMSHTRKKKNGAAVRKMVDTLLDAGADGSLRDDRGKTAFDYASDNDYVRGTPAYRRLDDARF